MSSLNPHKKHSDWHLLKQIIALAKPYKIQFAGAVFLAILLAFISPIRPVLIGKIVDQFVVKTNLPMLKLACILLVVLLLVEAVIRYFLNYKTDWLGQSVIKDLRNRTFKHVNHLKLSYFDKTPIGQSVTRTISDIETINNIFSQGLIAIFGDVLMIFSIIGWMFYTNWRLSLLSLVTLPFFVLATYVFKESIKKAFTIVRLQVSKMNSFLQEHISGMRIIQMFNIQQKEYEKFETINAEQRDANLKAVWNYSVFFPVVEILMALSVAIMIWGASIYILKRKAEIGDIFSFVLMINMLYRPLRMLADKFNTLQMGMVAAERVFHLLNTKLFIENKGNHPAQNIKGNIEFRDVCFSYTPDNPVLKNLSFKVAAGETLAIVGSTGSGKTSIINVLNRFYEIDSGKVLIDGVDARNFSLDTLRGMMSMVLQDVFLFRGSIQENISLNKAQISDESVMNALKMVGGNDIINQLPGGIHYKVRERGNSLSVGQRQLISFARALASNPAILILDEATSNIDTESERLIQHAIDELIKDRTSIIIAHRLSTIQKADNILVLNKGEIVEQGNHNQLIQLNGAYKKLYDMQFSLQV